MRYDIAFNLRTTGKSNANALGLGWEVWCDGM